MVQSYTLSFCCVFLDLMVQLSVHTPPAVFFLSFNARYCYFLKAVFYMLANMNANPRYVNLYDELIEGK